MTQIPENEKVYLEQKEAQELLESTNLFQKTAAELREKQRIFNALKSESDIFFQNIFKKYNLNISDKYVEKLDRDDKGVFLVLKNVPVPETPKEE